MEKIHVWSLNQKYVYLLLEDGFREEFFNTAFIAAMDMPYLVKKKEGTWQKLAIWLNRYSLRYGINSKINARNITCWRSAGRNHSRFVPMWIVIALQKLIQRKFEGNFSIFDLPLNYKIILGSIFQRKLFKKLRSICKGYHNLAKMLNIPQLTLEKYSRKEIKTIPVHLVLRMMKLFPKSISVSDVQNNMENSLQPKSFSLSEIEKHIIAYKYRNTSKPIWYPKLPIKVTPEFTSIIIHMMCDGHLPEESTGSYKQINLTSKSRFLSKLFNVFGKFEIPRKSFKNGDVKVYAIITHIIKTYVSEVKFGTFTSRIPQKILNKNREHKISALSAYIIDDGSVNNGIRLCSANRQLLNDMHLLTNSVYTTSPLRQYGDDYFYFDIRIPEASKFCLDLLKLIKKYPTCDLAHKQKKLEKLALKHIAKLKFTNFRHFQFKSIFFH